MQYQLKELFENLEITLTELSRRSGISDVTLISIRNGKSARRSTINTLLRVFSDIYGVKLTLKNVEGIIIQGKPVHRTTPAAERNAIASVSTFPSDTPSQKLEGQKVTTTTKKRDYKSRDTGLPDGCILTTHFARNHGIPRETFNDHMNRGLGPGLIGTSTDTIPERDRVKDYSEREKPGRPKEKERYLDPDQQKKTLQFWRRHGVSFTECESTVCWCHTLHS